MRERDRPTFDPYTISYIRDDSFPDLLSERDKQGSQRESAKEIERVKYRGN